MQMTKPASRARPATTETAMSSPAARPRPPRRLACGLPPFLAVGPWFLAAQAVRTLVVRLVECRGDHVQVAPLRSGPDPVSHLGERRQDGKALLDEARADLVVDVQRLGRPAHRPECVHEISGHLLVTGVLRERLLEMGKASPVPSVAERTPLQDQPGLSAFLRQMLPEGLRLRAVQPGQRSSLRQVEGPLQQVRGLSRIVAGALAGIRDELAKAPEVDR